MAPHESHTHDALVQRIRSVRAALHAATDVEARNGLLDELGAATKDLAELILHQEGRLKSPLE
jgi:hypothetical protein